MSLLRSPDRRPIVARALLALALAAVTIVPAGASSRARASLGTAAPPFVLAAPDGTDITLATFAHRPALLNVYASWCAACRREAAGLVAAYRRYRGRVAFLGIDEQESVGLAASFVRALHVPYPIALDGGQFAATYGSSRIPQTVFIDAHGVVRGIGVGAMTPRQIDAHLSKLVSTRGST